MLSQSIFYNTRDLPSDILTLIDDSFYDFIEQRLGVHQSSLLKLQQINSVACLLSIDDPCQVLNLNINDHELNELKKQICFLLSDGSFIVKPGVKLGFKCLRDLLSKKNEEKLKQSRNRKTQSTIAVPINILTSPSSYSTTSQTTTTSTLHATTIAPTTTSRDLSLTLIPEHRKYVLDLLKQWCLNHKNDFMLDTFDLKEGKDFILNIKYNENNDLDASIKCNCGRVIVLSITNGKVQLSNYQKHLRMTSCNYMKVMKEKHEEQKKLNLKQTTSVSSSSTSVSLAPLPTQQSILQVPVILPTGASSIVVGPTSDTQTTISQTSSRKRGRSSQLSLTQKTKKRRA